ncbi:beta-lactamase/transpeptidase-like protein [Chytriomyces sp. MP71]|nr:beta-lactamase/transpeptidase-like protein [Chytriomyces sp. MP71]
MADAWDRVAEPQRDLRAPPDRRLLALDAHCSAALSDFDADGCAVTIVAGGKMVFAKGFRSLEAPANPWSQRASISQPSFDADSSIELGRAAEGILAVAIATLVQSNQLQWDTPLSTILPSFSLDNPSLARIVTVSDLLSHRAGLPSASHTLANLISDASPASMIPSAINVVNQGQTASKAFRGTRQYSFLTAPIVTQLLTSITKEPIEVFIQEAVFNQISASRSSGFIAQGREDVTLSMTSCARDLGRLAASLLDTWGPLSVETLEAFLSPAGAVRPQDAYDSSPECGGHRVCNGGWIDSVHRGKRKVGFGGFSASSAVEVCLFPNDGLAIVAVCSKACNLPAAIVNVAADFLMEENPAPWVPRLEDRPFPSLDIKNVGVPEESLQPMPRSANYYTGTYACFLFPSVAFRVSQVGGELKVRFISGQSEGLPRNAELKHYQNGLFYAESKDLLPFHLGPFSSSHVCGFLFENGLDGSVETLTVLNTLKTPKSEGTLFSKTVPHQPSFATLASREELVTILPPTAPPSSRPSEVPAPALPPRRSTSNTPSAQVNGVQPPPVIPLSPPTSSGLPPQLPPRSRQASSVNASQLAQSFGGVSPPLVDNTANPSDHLLVRNELVETKRERSNTATSKGSGLTVEEEEVTSAMIAIDDVMADLGLDK